MDTAFFKNFSPKIENNNTTVNLKYSLLHSYWSSPSRIHPYEIIYTSRMQHWKILQQFISLFKSFDLKPTKLKPNFFSKNQQHPTWLSLRKRKALLNWDLNNLMTWVSPLQNAKYVLKRLKQDNVLPKICTILLLHQTCNSSILATLV